MWLLPICLLSIRLLPIRLLPIWYCLLFSYIPQLQLTFDRITVTDALNHPWVKNTHNLVIESKRKRDDEDNEVHVEDNTLITKKTKK
jgi:hypothetical protein